MARKGRRSVYERLMSHVVKSEGCWGWDGYIDNFGYGRLMMPGGPVRAHRLSYVLHSGEIPKGKYVLHRCDNRVCTNPDHLYVGTAADNAADMVSRGRRYTGVPDVGEAHHQAKLTESAVLAIRAANESTHELAHRYGVSASAIGLVKRRVTWRHLP